MQFSQAKVADILRCTQRDEEFVSVSQDDVASIFKIFFGNNNYNLYKNYVPFATTAWYYYQTSLCKLQTLGEEYAGILRLVGKNKIPSTLIQLLWMTLFIGGEPLLTRLLKTLKQRVSLSKSLTNNAKNYLLRSIEVVNENKQLFVKINQSLFFINGMNNTISNRLTGIKYVLVRPWLQDDSSSKAFEILGKLSLVYLAIYVSQQYLAQKKDYKLATTETKSSRKMCILCVENCKNSSATPCGHIFCWECIYDSLRYNPKCPVCRETINPSRIVLLQNYV